MLQLRLDPAGGFKKCARVVGDVIGKFHPHGDVAVYDALVRLAQDFAQRYPLVDGQGNFGNIDGDNAAAMRYTESRLTAVAMALLEGIDEDAVDFRDNYDGSDDEPVVLPAAFPNLLANGASGIAVGMATSIPPHNAGELLSALAWMAGRSRAPPGQRSRSCCATSRDPTCRPAACWSSPPPASPRPTGPAAAASACARGGRRRSWPTASTRSWSPRSPTRCRKGRLIERMAELLNLKKLPLLGDLRDESTEAVRLVLVPRSRAVDARAADGAAVPADRARGAPVAQHERAGRHRRAAGDEPGRGARGLSRPPHGGAGPPLPAPAGQGRGPARGAGGLPQGLPRPRRGDPDHPRGGRAQAGADGALRAHRPPGRGHLQPAPAQSAQARGDGAGKRAGPAEPGAPRAVGAVGRRAKGCAAPG